MTFTGRIRLYLVLVALLPPLLVTAAVYYEYRSRIESDRLIDLRSRISSAADAIDNLETQIEISSLQLASSAEIKRALSELNRYGEIRTELNPISYHLSFVELLDSTGTVVYSLNRPGLVGNQIGRDMPMSSGEATYRIEIDYRGMHQSLVTALPANEQVRLYTGRFLDSSALDVAQAYLNTELRSIPVEQLPPTYQATEIRKLYQTDSSFYVILTSPQNADFVYLADWRGENRSSMTASLLKAAIPVTLVSALVAILLGIIITGRAKKEVDNLAQAAERISRGDLDEPVMAYEEGEFSQLADAFTSMTLGLKKTRGELAITEKIAAWQTIGRTIAHEIKNPLSPIAISAEDLRRSYKEKQPDFEIILDEATGTIKKEVTRLTGLLDEFVTFARMKPPRKRDVLIKSLTGSLTSLYRSEIESGRLRISADQDSATANIDPDQFGQAAINLIKNGLESKFEAIVQVALRIENNHLCLTIEDDGPGFPEEKLTGEFEPFASTKKGGSGLGLVVCHRIARDHGGKLRIYNREQGGAGAELTLPLE